MSSLRHRPPNSRPPPSPPPLRLSSAMARVLRFVRLEYEEGTSSKFHSQEVTATPDGLFLHKATWGKIGTAGTTQKAHARGRARARQLGARR